MMKNVKWNKRIATLVLAGGIALLGSGCEKEMAVKEQYDIVYNGESEDGTAIMSNGLTQILDVPEEEFKLVTEYKCDSASRRVWRITSDKMLGLKVYTQGLPKDTSVWIDNVHIDTSIKSQYAAMDGILQDTMDDRIHNTAMMGFPIADDIPYIGVNAIEGCNETFISGSYYGFSGYSSGTVTQERYTERDYMRAGVYANKFSIVYDLLIQSPKDKTPRNTSVKTDFLVPVTEGVIVDEDYFIGQVKEKEKSK